MKITVALFAAFLAVLSSCRPGENTVSVSGVVWSSTEEGLYIELVPDHYKYAVKRRVNIKPTENGTFSTEISFNDDDDLAWLVLGDFSTPILLRNGNDLKITQSAEIPELFQISGYDRDWQAVFNAYVNEDRRMMNAVRNERSAFRNGEVEETIRLYKTRVHLAKSHLSDSPYRYYIHRTTGEYLTTRLRAVEIMYSGNQTEATSAREKILEEAQNLDFFSYASLRAQRAGIRDFTDAWANTFGVRDSLEKKLNQKLMAYDVKRLGYERLNEARQFIVDKMPAGRARAWSEMHLVVERLGEAPFQTAELSFIDFKKNFADFPEYLSLAESLYTDIKKVSPGSIAPSFEFVDANGKRVSSDRFKGKYVLLDFWAQWCSPCLEEFPHMNRIYQEFKRDEFEIVAISIDQDQKTWLEAIKSHKNPWVQLWGGREFENELFKTYRGGGIPFYVLIAPDGKILRYNDIRPSFNLEDVLNEALGRNYAYRGRN